MHGPDLFFIIKLGLIDAKIKELELERLRVIDEFNFENRSCGIFYDAMNDEIIIDE